MQRCRKGCSVVALQTLFAYVISEEQGQIGDEDDDMAALDLLLQSAALVEGASDDFDDSVFMQSFIPRSLHDVENCEDEESVLRKGGREAVFIGRCMCIICSIVVRLFSFVMFSCILVKFVDCEFVHLDDDMRH